MTKHVVLCLAGALLCAAPAHGQARDTLRITWPDVARIADRHPRLAASAFEVDAARGAAAAAGSLPNPTLEASVTRGEIPEGSPNRREWSAELGLPLGWLAKRHFQVSAASAQVATRRAEAAALRRDVLVELRALFLGLAHGQARVAALEQLHDQAAELARGVARRVETGEARPTEGTRVEIELERAASDLESSRSALESRRTQLGLWIKGPAGAAWVADADLDSIPAVPGLDGVLAAVRTRHPSVDAARAAVRARAAELGSEQVARVPELSVRGFTVVEPERRAHGGALAIDVPLWNWNSGNVAQARAQLAAGRQQLEWVTRELESAAIELHGACVSNTQAATRYRDRILPRSESAARVMEKAYRLGEADLLEVIDARRVLAETRLQYLDVLLQAQLDCSRLSALTGQEIQP
jgi:outer membrane protein, heavy metal efflux system